MIALFSTEKLSEPFALSVNTIQSDFHVGRMVTGTLLRSVCMHVCVYIVYVMLCMYVGKVESGVVSIGDKIKVLSPDGKTLVSDAKVTTYTYIHTYIHTYIR